MKRRLLALSVGLLLACGLVPVPALAANIVLDQHNETSDHWFGMTNPSLAQSFTVGIAGTLASISLRMFCDHSGHIDILLVGADASGLPTNTYLGSGWGAATKVDAWVSFATSAIHLTAGQHVAFIVHGYADCDWRGSTNNPYAGGVASYYGNGAWHPFPPGSVDFCFRTYVTPLIPVGPPIPVNPTSSSAPINPTSAPAPTAAPAASATQSGQSEAPTTQTEMPTSGETEAVLTAPPDTEAASASANATATPAASTGGSNESGGPPVLMLAAAIVVLALLGGLGCLLVFLFLRRRRREPPAEVPPPAEQPATGRSRRPRRGGG